MAFQTVSEFTLKSCADLVRTAAKSRYFVGICAAPDAAGLGAAAALAAGALVPGICAAPEAAVTGAAGVERTTTAFSSTLEPALRGWALPK